MDTGYPTAEHTPLAEAGHAYIQCKDFRKPRRIAQYACRDAAQRVAGLDHVEAQSILFLDRYARQWDREHVTGVNDPCPAERAAIRHHLADITLDNALDSAPFP